MATTSFMVRPSFPGFRKVGHGLICARRASLASFAANGTKSCRLVRKTIAAASLPLGSLLYRGRDYPSKCGLIVRRLVAHPSVSAPKGNEMSDRSWFYASHGQQQGPYPEAQLRELIARGTVTADTLVWSEGMAGWQQARKFRACSQAARVRRLFRAPGGPLAGAGGYGGGPLSIDLGLWDFLGRSLVFVDRISAGDPGALGGDQLLPVDGVPPPRAAAAQSRLHRPGRRYLVRLRRDGAVSLCRFDAASQFLQYRRHCRFRRYLSWMTVRWIAANLSSNGQPLPIAFNGSALSLCRLARADVHLGHHHHRLGVGHHCLDAMDVPQCQRHAARDRLQRDRAWKCCGGPWCSALGCMLLIPIPWVLRWYTSWYVSQFELVDRAA